MSTAFSDFGPLTERRRVERQRQQRRRVMLAAGAASVVLILIVMGGAAVAYNASTQDDSSSSSSSSSPSPSGGGSGSGSNLISASKSVKMMCAQTDYRDACEKSLSKAAANASVSSPQDIVRAAVAVIGDALGNAFNRSEVIKSDDPRVKAAVADCREIYQNAKDDLRRTLHGIDASSMDGVDKRGYELRVLLSAVIAHMETCIDGFPDGDLKKQMTDTMESGKELTSNALAIIEKASSVLVALHIPGFTHRRLLGNNGEENMENQPEVNHSGMFRGRDAAAPAADNRRLLSIDEEENMENEPKVKHSSTFLGELKYDDTAADSRRLLSVDEEENMENQPKVKHSGTFLGELKDDVTAADNRRLLSVDEEENMENQPKVKHSGTFLGGRNDDVPAADNRRLLSIEEDTPQWVNGPERRLLKGNFQGKLKPNVVVAKDGSGKFKTINDALNAMPKQYTGRYLIYVKQGVYEEYVTITRAMENVTMYGDGAMKTVITGSRNFADGLTTYKTATFSTRARRRVHRHRAGVPQHGRRGQAPGGGAAGAVGQVHLPQLPHGRVPGHAVRALQGAVLPQLRHLGHHRLRLRRRGGRVPELRPAPPPAHGQPAEHRHGAGPRGRPREHGLRLPVLPLHRRGGAQGCVPPAHPGYLARPWREFSRTLIMECDIPAFIDKAGYLPWNGDFGLKTLWYAEYANRGPGADIAGRVAWPGYKKVISKEEADKFTVQNFLHAEPWLKPTGTPVKYGFWA
ncbi:unnamed protein product [Miscanthus lutarioriparius]|uniref:Pectinesterase inhibitor domain-containing protein n=1 Tax=Miscanthus lutarioriparius TaxID=422564 RepID=A0A811R5H5_9POAL|nr:unnamed protein product [Miscanthus lutarioriparius]